MTAGAFTVKAGRNIPPEGTYLGDLWARTSEITISKISNLMIIPKGIKPGGFKIPGIILSSLIKSAYQERIITRA